MIKIVYCMRRKVGLSPQEFLSHWEQVHAPIVLANLDVLHLARYVRTQPVAHAFSQRVERRGLMQSPYDGIAELAWRTEEDMRAGFESPEALAVQRLLARDESLFVDHVGSCRWVASETIEI
ncbi:MAG: EthD domain-containing protein [Devosia sp.]